MLYLFKQIWRQSRSLDLRALLRALWFVLRQPRLAPPEPCPSRGSRHDHDDLPVVWIAGTPYQRGFQHGVQLRPEIERFRRSAWVYAPHAAVTYIGLPIWVAALLTKPLLLLWSALYLPHLATDVRAEIQGLADGAQIPLREIVVNTVIWEVFGSLTGRGPRREHCSEFALDASQTGALGPLLGYNYDLMAASDRVLVDGFIALFVVRPNHGNSYIAPNTIGSIGLNTAMNAHGVAFGWDNSYLRPNVAGNANSLPFMLLLRELALTATSVEDAAKRLRGEQRPEADISVIADTDRVGVIEIAGVESAYRGGAFVWSCNRLQALIDHDYKGAGRRADGRHERYPAVLQDLPRPVSVADVIAVLRDRGGPPEQRQIADRLNAFAVVYAPRLQRLWLSHRGAPASHQPMRAFSADGQRYPADDVV